MLALAWLLNHLANASADTGHDNDSLLFSALVSSSRLVPNLKQISILLMVWLSAKLDNIPGYIPRNL